MKKNSQIDQSEIFQNIYIYNIYGAVLCSFYYLGEIQ